MKVNQQSKSDPTTSRNMNEFIPYGRQEISDEDIQAVVDVLRSSHLTQGEAVPIFESAIAKTGGIKLRGRHQ